MRVVWDAATDTPPIADALSSAGFDATVPDGRTAGGGAADDDTLSRHVRALAVAGFAAGNVMMLSVAVWSGADAATRALFHALSAVIALPALAYSGRIFFASAWRAVRAGRTNMDVPIAIGIVATVLMSVHDTVIDGNAVYFDAALMLVFFLLVGRTLDRRMRDRARDAADAVSRLEPRGGDVVQPDGSVRFEALADLRAGDLVRVAPGARVPVDAEVERGGSSVDRSLVSGESVPVDVSPGARVHAGTLVVTAPLELRATADAEGSFLADIRRMMQDAEGAKGRYRRVSDRAAALYAPVVHVTAAASLLAWLAIDGDAHRAVSVAVAVLIITCPCALGLAVPVVQVIAARRLLGLGVLMKDGGALERLAEVDTVLFDKTGTLTTGRPSWTVRVAAGAESDAPPGVATGSASTRATGPAEEALAIARALARTSRHPHARALANGPESVPSERWTMDATHERPGAGVEGVLGASVYRLGRADWALGRIDAGHAGARDDTRLDTRDETSDAGTSTGDGADAADSISVLACGGRELATFRFHDTPRADARACLDALHDLRLDVALVSGDAPAPVARLAASLSLTRHEAAALPADKLARVRSLEAAGHHVLMVGDGLNDAPALSAASASAAPGSASDVGRLAADFVLLDDRLLGVPGAVSIARRAHALVRQNLALAVAYNVCAVPLAVSGLVTPLVAAVSMSLSSVLVVANALRLTRGGAP